MFSDSGVVVVLLDCLFLLLNEKLYIGIVMKINENNNKIKYTWEGLKFKHL